MKENKIKRLSEKTKENELEPLSERMENIEWWHISICYGIHTYDPEPLSIISDYGSAAFVKEEGRMVINICSRPTVSERGEWNRLRRSIKNGRMFEYE